MPQRRTVLPPKIDEPEVVVVPLGLRQQRLEVSFGLFHCLALCEPPALRQPVDVRVHRKSWSPAWLLVGYCLCSHRHTNKSFTGMPADARYPLGASYPSSECQLAPTLSCTQTVTLDTLCCNANLQSSMQ